MCPYADLGLTAANQSFTSSLQSLADFPCPLRDKTQKLHQPQNIVCQEHSEPRRAEYNKIVPACLRLAEVALITVSTCLIASIQWSLEKSNYLERVIPRNLVAFIGKVIVHLDNVANGIECLARSSYIAHLSDAVTNLNTMRNGFVFRDRRVPVVGHHPFVNTEL